MTANEWIDIAKVAAPSILSLSLTYWVYKVFNSIVKDLKEQVSNLKKDVDVLKKSENRWFRKYHVLSNIIARRGCRKTDCPILLAYNDFNEKEGETV